jgi:MFS transporter, FHS family, glucose/mannose:H+ symporter
MKNWQIKVALYLNYFVFAILLNSVGIVIQKSLNVYKVGETQASNLELAKDFSILGLSFLIAPFLPRLGYKKGMLAALFIAFCGCLSMYVGNSFGSALVLFAATGLAFGLIKVSVYSVIGLVTDSTKEHNAMMSSIEAFFMVGIAAAYFIFPYFYSETDPNSWLKVYLLLAVLVAISFLFLLFARFDEPPVETAIAIKGDFMKMLNLITLPMVLIFVLCAFLFVMVEQGIMSWLPTFNQKILQLPEKVSVQMAAILAFSLAIGRLMAGELSKRFSWLSILSVCLVISMIIVVTVLPKTADVQTTTIHSLSDIPMIAFIFPLVGIFIAPIYPLINSVMLSALPKELHSSMTGLIVVFSALGGTLGSRVIGYLFEMVGGGKAFYFTLIPMGLLLLGLFIFNNLVKKQVN